MDARGSSAVQLFVGVGCTRGALASFFGRPFVAGSNSERSILSTFRFSCSCWTGKRGFGPFNRNGTELISLVADLILRFSEIA